METLLTYLNAIKQRILSSVSRIPPIMRVVFKRLRQRIEERWPGPEYEVSYQSYYTTLLRKVGGGANHAYYGPLRSAQSAYTQLTARECLNIRIMYFYWNHFSIRNPVKTLCCSNFVFLVNTTACLLIVIGPQVCWY